LAAVRELLNCAVTIAVAACAASAVEAIKQTNCVEKRSFETYKVDSFWLTGDGKLEQQYNNIKRAEGKCCNIADKDVPLGGDLLAVG
jgi:hypothetical protein